MYGINKTDLSVAQDKLDFQKSYLKKQSFINALGNPKTLLDISMSANFSSKYYAEVANRVNTIASFSIDYEQSPVFLTITLNGCFRGALHGDYSKFKALDRKYIPQELKYKIKEGKNMTISDLVRILNYQWQLFIMRLNFKFKKVERSYIRCFEPHKKDGVPHIHALFYVPAHVIPFMLKIYKDLFNAPQNLRTNAITPEQARNGEINGFQTSINNPSGYVMKYIQKTFINVKETDKLDELSAWYVKHKVRRFLSSRSKVPLWVYRKINFISSFQDFYHLCDIKNDEDSVIEWDYLSSYIYINMPRHKESLIYDNGKLEHYICGRLMNSYDLQKPKFESASYRVDGKCPTNEDINDRMECKRFNEWLDFVFRKKHKPVSKMKNYELVSYYQNLDKQNCNIQHLAYIENLMIDRNLELFVKTDIKHDLNSPSLESFIERNLREYEF